MVKQWNEERDRTDLKNRELEKSLGIALQAIKRLEEMMQAEKLGKAGEEQTRPGGRKESRFFPTREIPAGGSTIKTHLQSYIC